MMAARWSHAAALGAMALALLGGCASKDRLPPAPLQQIKPQIAGRQVWHASLSSKIRFPLAIASVRIQKMRLGKPDVSGRQSPELIEGADYDEPAEMVIKALGFEPEELPRLWGVEGLETTRWGTIKADFRSHQTSLSGVFAVGDIVRGASLVVWAIRDGREAADSIAEYLGASVRVAAE